MKSGFTLIELVVVVIILGVLAGFSITKLGNVDEAAYVSTMKQDASHLITNVTTFYSKEQSFPDSFIGNPGGTKTGTSPTPLYLNLNGTPSNVMVTGSPFNIIDYKRTIGGCGSTDQIEIKITNSKVPSKTIVYDSCSSSGIQLI
jgi:prepilin-type N-terminal cleavage/methylation domain-containing protein